MKPLVILIVPIWYSGKEVEGYRVPVPHICCYYPDPGSLPECKDRTIMQIVGVGILTIPRPIDKIDWALKQCWAAVDNIVFIKIV